MLCNWPPGQTLESCGGGGSGGGGGGGVQQRALRDLMAGGVDAFYWGCRRGQAGFKFFRPLCYLHVHTHSYIHIYM